MSEHQSVKSQASEGCNIMMDNWKADEEKEQDVDDEEEDDTDFNPCLIAEEEASEASSSLSSEDEGSADNSQRHSLLRLENQGKDAACESVDITVIQDVECENKDQPGQRSISLEDWRRETLSTDEVKRSSHDLVKKTSSKAGGRDDDEDAICMRTRARHSLADYSLEELETFLQESDDDDDLQHVDDEEEYRKFLSAVLSSGNELVNERNVDENLDEDEENDADFEIEIEEALDSDADENNRGTCDWKENKKKERRGVGMRQKRTQRASTINKNIPLRPILPSLSTTRVDSSQGWQPSFPQTIPNSLSKAEPTFGFTSHQIGQLFCLINEHIQLLIQVFSLSIHDPTRQHVASEVESLLLEMSDKREEALALRKLPYPLYCFDYTNAYQSINLDPSQRANSPWAPPVNNLMLSVLDVKPLDIGKKYIVDVSASILRYRRDQVEGKHVRNQPKKEPLFSLKNDDMAQETTAEVIDGADSTVGSIISSVLTSQVQKKKTLAPAKMEKTEKPSIALVPSEIATLAQTFSTLFNPSLFPLKPPPPAVANRALFTDSEDRLLAMGLMEYNNDWRAIQRRFLPCKSEHQIFVRQKNRASSKAPENPIKAIRRMKTSPLTAEEKVLIAEGLKVFKHEWISVWRYFVPHRDPSLLPRQWRIATGTQKSYRKDESMNEKRRLYEAHRRKSRAPTSDWNSTLSENEFDDADNEDEAYVHEAFLADNELLGSEHQDPVNCQINGFHQSSKSTGQQIANPLPSSSKQGHYPYKMRKRKGAQVVKLAPELPPVNLPPSVRVISQSAFRNYQPALTSSTADKNSGKVIIPRLTKISKPDISKNRTLQDPREENNCETDMQLHPLLFQMGDADMALYRSTAVSQRPTLRIPRLGSERLTLTGIAMDFHPLFLRADGQHLESESLVDQSQPSNSQTIPHDRDVGVDLINSRRTVVPGISGSGRMQESDGQLLGRRENGVDFEPPVCSEDREDPASLEIVMEQEELSDSEEEADDVEFECEEMDDSEGEDVDAASQQVEI